MPIPSITISLFYEGFRPTCVGIFFRGVSFLRLKSEELGYTLPKDLTAKVGIQKARIYVNGANLFTIDNYKIADPEAGVTRNDNNEVINSNGVLSYPLQRTITFGANITF